MQDESTAKMRGRFRRVSKARVFDGHVFKAGFFAVSAMVLAYMLMTAVISLLFIYFHEVPFNLVLWTLPAGALLGYILLIVERTLGQFKEIIFPGMGKLLTAFLLFFAHTIGYIALSSIIVSYPVGSIMEKTWGMAGAAAEYSLFSVNFFIVLAVLSWLRNVKTPPCRCFS